MQEARMVRVLDVLEHQLPVAGDPLAQVAEHNELTASEHTIEVAEHVFAEIILERFVLRRKAGEHDAVPARHREPLKPVLFPSKIGRHAALTAIPPAEWHAEQIAAEIIGPLMIGAD